MVEGNLLCGVNAPQPLIDQRAAPGCLGVLAQKCVWFLPMHIFCMGKNCCICCISHISWHLNALLCIQDCILHFLHSVGNCISKLVTTRPFTCTSDAHAHAHVTPLRVEPFPQPATWRCSAALQHVSNLPIYPEATGPSPSQPSLRSSGCHLLSQRCHLCYELTQQSLL